MHWVWFQLQGGTNLIAGVPQKALIHTILSEISSPEKVFVDTVDLRICEDGGLKTLQVSDHHLPTCDCINHPCKEKTEDPQKLGVDTYKGGPYQTDIVLPTSMNYAVMIIAVCVRMCLCVCVSAYVCLCT